MWKRRITTGEKLPMIRRGLRKSRIPLSPSCFPPDQPIRNSDLQSRLSDVPNPYFDMYTHIEYIEWGPSQSPSQASMEARRARKGPELPERPNRSVWAPSHFLMPSVGCSPDFPITRWIFATWRFETFTDDDERYFARGYSVRWHVAALFRSQRWPIGVAVAGSP